MILLGAPTVRIGYLNILDHLITVSVGENANGSPLERQPCDVQTIELNNWVAMKNALCDGCIHGGFLPLPEAMSLFSSGLAIKIVLLDCRPGTLFLSNNSAGIKKINDFRGKTVLISSLLSVYNILLYRLMNSAGLTTGFQGRGLADVYIEIVPPFMIPEMIRCDIDGDIAGCMVEEPFASTLIHEGYGKKVCLSKKLWQDHPHTALVIRQEVINNNRLAVSSLVRCLVESNRYVYNGSPDLGHLLEKFFGKKDQIIKELSLSSLQKQPLSLIPDIKFLEIINDFMVREMGLLDAITDMSALVDLQFVLETGA